MATRRLPFSVARAARHLVAADPVVAALIAEHGPYRPRPGTDPYAALVITILSQQLAGPAARTIRRNSSAHLRCEPSSPSGASQPVRSSGSGPAG